MHKRDARDTSTKHARKLSRMAYAMQRWTDGGHMMQMAFLKKERHVIDCGCIRYVNRCDGCNGKKR